MATVTLTFPCPGFLQGGDPCGEIEVEAEIDPAESNYGADADGNRGMYVSASIVPPDAPAQCPECGLVYSEQQLSEINAYLAKEAENYEVDPPDLNDGL